MPSIIIDTDPGVDDAMAIAYALCHPDVELLGLTTVFGNVSVDMATRNAQYLLHQFGATDVAVAGGVGAPLVQAPLSYPDFVHGADGLGNCYPASADAFDPAARHATVDTRDAADFIIDSARERPGEITLVAIGPLSNIATALQREPALPGLIKQLVIMGGTVMEAGNVTPLAEANFVNDPHAADIVFSGDWPAVAVGLDVTHRILLTDTHLARLRDQAGTTGQLIWDTSRFYVDFYTTTGAAKSGSEPACAMHDAAAVAYTMLPEAFTTVAGPARVISDGMAAGQLAIAQRDYQQDLPDWADRPRSTRACLDVEADSVREHFLDTLVRHHRV